MESRLAGLFIATTFVGLRLLGLNAASNEPFRGLLLVVMGLGLGLLALVLVIVAHLWNVRQTGLRRTIRPVILTAYVTSGVWIHHSTVSQYARDLAEYRPDGDCGSWGGDQSGCAPWDGRVSWLIFWAIVGLLALAAVRLRSSKVRQVRKALMPNAHNG